MYNTRPLLVIVLLLLLTGCAQQRSATYQLPSTSISDCSGSALCSNPSWIYGLWGLAPSSQAQVPPSCQSITLYFTPTKLTMRSGEFISIASYRIENSQSDLVLQMSGISSNNKPNCQGIPAKFVISHFVYTNEMEVIGERLRYYLFRKNDGRYMDLVRLSNE